MAGLIASILALLVIWQLFRLNREENVRTSKALWIPTFWLFIAASRNVSQWLQYSSGGGGDQYLEGSPLDRVVLSAVLGPAGIVLLVRGPPIVYFFKLKFFVLLYFFFFGRSVICSFVLALSFNRG